MPPKSTTWRAEPHTLAKHLILRKYLGGWLPSLGSWQGRVLFIDGFCGPGEYTGGEDGSPIIALKTLLGHPYLVKMTGEFVFIFIDKDPDRIGYLKNVALPKLGKLPANVHVICEAARFDVAMTSIFDHLEEQDALLAPALAFVDPFGIKDTPMDLIARILRHGRSEVFVTVMLEPINRFLEHPDQKVLAHFDALFGRPDWRQAAKAPQRVDALGDLYAQQLRKFASYVWSFRMLDHRNRPVYDLFFASKHIEGLKKMKKAMWNADPGGGNRFSDRSAEDITLFEPSLDTTSLQKAMVERFSGKTVTYRLLEEWVLLETPYHDSHIKRRTLSPLEQEEQIEYISPPSVMRPRRKGTWPQDCSIRFR